MTEQACCCKENCSSATENESNKYFIIRLIISAIIFAVALAIENNLYLMLASFAFSGGDVIIQAVKNILKGKVFDENFLMTIATVGAFIIGEYPEGAAVMLFFQAGELLQDISAGHSRKAITSLMDIRPTYATLISGTRLPPEVVEINDLILVKPGERIPLDGIVTEGNAAVDTSALTGESIPKDVSKGDNVLSGTVCVNGVLTIQVTKPYSESTVAKILELTQNASSKKSHTERFITRFAKVYTPIVTSLAV